MPSPSAQLKMPPGKAVPQSINFTTETVQTTLGPKAERAVELLLVAPTGNTQALFSQAFECSNWHLETAASTATALLRLGQAPMGVVVYQESSPAQGGADGWLELLEASRNLAHPPKVIVATRQATDRLWAEVLHQGGYDVLPLPLEAAELIRTVSMAWLEWRREQEHAPAARAMAASY